ncbi:MAG TPA: Gfo/Idh/MocA family oxidoreductase [Polyangiaceae bacterium]
MALIGLGTMGTRHARVLSALPDRFTIARAYDVDRGRATAAPQGISRCRNEAEALAGVDVAIVATPILTHAPIVSRALAAGLHVLVEKPLCATTAESRALLEAQRRGGARLFAGHSERFNPVVRALARLVRGERVLAIDLKRVGPSRPSEVGVLLNLGVHDFDLAAYLGGGPLELRGAVGGDDLAQVVFETAGGGAGHLYVDRTAPERRRSIVVTTSRWVYEGDLLSHRLVRTARVSGARSDVPLPLEEPLLAQARSLADALDGTGSRELATGEDGAAAVSLAEQASTLCAPVGVAGEGPRDSKPDEDLSLLARA